MHTLLLDQHCYKACPARLVAGAETRTIFSMKVLVEQEMVTKVGVTLHHFIVAIKGTMTSLIAQEKPNKAL
jgi:hypothetical protein